jgi:hypothetical protein
VDCSKTLVIRRMIQGKKTCSPYHRNEAQGVATNSIRTFGLHLLHVRHLLVDGVIPIIKRSSDFRLNSLVG